MSSSPCVGGLLIFGFFTMKKYKRAKTTKPKKASVRNQKVKLAGSAGSVSNIK
ncbi:MAG: hypothetical protein ACOVO9_04775 [Bacteroidia bacterium]